MKANNSPDVYVYDPDRCPWTATWRVIGQKWKGIIWWRLSNGIGRFGELQRAIPQITKKVLTQQLREMVRDGIVGRRVVEQAAKSAGGGSGGHRGLTMVEYSLTEYGRSLAPAIEAICKWGARHLERRCVTAPPIST